MEFYRIKRGPTAKTVSGLYRDESEAIAKAEDLEATYPFHYWVESVEKPAAEVLGA